MATTSMGKALVRRLIGKKGARPQSIYTHPQHDKVGPHSLVMPMPKMPMKGKY